MRLEMRLGGREQTEFGKLLVRQSFGATGVFADELTSEREVSS